MTYSEYVLSKVLIADAVLGAWYGAIMGVILAELTANIAVLLDGLIFLLFIFS